MVYEAAMSVARMLVSELRVCELHSHEAEKQEATAPKPQLQEAQAATQASSAAKISS